MNYLKACLSSLFVCRSRCLKIPLFLVVGAGRRMLSWEAGGGGGVPGVLFPPSRAPPPARTKVGAGGFSVLRHSHAPEVVASRSNGEGRKQPARGAQRGRTWRRRRRRPLSAPCASRASEERQRWDRRGWAAVAVLALGLRGRERTGRRSFGLTVALRFSLSCSFQLRCVEENRAFLQRRASPGTEAARGRFGNISSPSSVTFQVSIPFFPAKPRWKVHVLSLWD